MTEIILAHPYSGALYRYFSDEIGGSTSHSTVAASHPYYKTLYGKESLKNIELALTFLILHDDVWIAPADNHWPRSKARPDDKNRVAELGLNTDWNDFQQPDHAASEREISHLLSDERLRNLLANVLLLPEDNWPIAVRYALHESSLSASRRIPILCSPGRRQLISTLVSIQQPSLQPLFSVPTEVQFVETYRRLTGLALKPQSLEDLMDAKPDKDVRKYARAFIAAAEASTAPDATSLRALARVTLDAIETERIAKIYTGGLNWISHYFRAIQEPALTAIASIGSFFSNRVADEAGWYEFQGSIDRAVTRSMLIRRLESYASGERGETSRQGRDTNFL